MVNRLNLKLTLVRLLTIPAILVLISCSSHHLRYEPGIDRTDDHDRQNIPEPKKVDPVLAWQSFDRSFWQQGEELFDLDRSFRKLIGRPKEAYNFNRLDEVPNSSWFTNRFGSEQFKTDQLGMASNFTGPDTSGSWTVFRHKVQGKMPGLWILDSRGDSYIIKFDPPTNPELHTGATAIGSRFLHYCGFNVPEETIVHWQPAKLELKPGIMFVDGHGDRREMTRADLDEMLKNAHLMPDGSIRSLASKLLDGNILGPFKYDGRRGDDPNDWCPHEHRRELRALYVIASFINHYDTKDQNTLDTYVEEDGRKYVKHNLIDFGSTFGSNGDRPKTPDVGYCNTFDLRDVLVSWCTLGLKKWSWEDGKPYQYQSIGYFESEIFQPNKWNPIVPNPAFENMTPRDAYWGAKIVLAWRDENIRELVETGQYSDPEAKEYLIKTLIERRDKIGRYWFSKVAPLDDIELADKDGAVSIRFEDLAVKYGLADGAGSQYDVSVAYNGKAIIRQQSGADRVFELNSADRKALVEVYRDEKKNEDKSHLYEVRMRVKRADSGWSKPVLLWLWYHSDDSRFELIGIEHLY